jgi:hypothetical protein
MGLFNMPLVNANLMMHCTILVQHKLLVNQSPSIAVGKAFAAGESELATEQ